MVIGFLLPPSLFVYRATKDATRKASVFPVPTSAYDAEKEVCISHSKERHN